MFPFVEYLLLGLAAVALIMGALIVSIVTRARGAARELRMLEEYEPG